MATTDTPNEILAKADKKMPYRIPEHFFEDSTERVLEIVHKKNRSRKFGYLAIAACLVLITGIGFLLSSRNSYSDMDAFLSRLSPEDVEYLCVQTEDDWFSEEY